MLGVSTSLLRFWETEFRYLNPKKSRRGDRQYTKKDIELIHKIYELVKIQGYTLDGAKKALKEKPVTIKSNNNDKAAIITKLENIKKGLQTLQNGLKSQ